MASDEHPGRGEEPPAFRKRALVMLGVLVVNVVADQWTKALAVKHLKEIPPHRWLGDSVRLMYAENEGAFLSLGESLPDPLRFWVLGIIPLLILIGMMAWALTSKELRLGAVIGVAFVAGGGLSNMYDRLLFGYVVDFMNLGLGNLRTGVFNVADLSILAGLPFLLFGGEPSAEASAVGAKEASEVSVTQ